MRIDAPSEVWPREMPVSRKVTQGRFPGGTPELWRGPSQPRPVQRLRGARRVGVAWLVPCLARAVSGDGCPGGLLLGWAPGSRGWRAAEISRRGRKRGHHLAVQQAGSRPLPGGKPPSPAAALRSRVPPSRDQPQHPLGWVAEARTPLTAPPTCRAALHGARERRRLWAAGPAIPQVRPPIRRPRAHVRPPAHAGLHGRPGRAARRWGPAVAGEVEPGSAPRGPWPWAPATMPLCPPAPRGRAAEPQADAVRPVLRRRRPRPLARPRGRQRLRVSGPGLARALPRPSVRPPPTLWCLRRVMEGPIGRARSDRSQTRTPRREGPPDGTRPPRGSVSPSKPAEAGASGPT